MLGRACLVNPIWLPAAGPFGGKLGIRSPTRTNGIGFCSEAVASIDSELSARYNVPRRASHGGSKGRGTLSVGLALPGCFPRFIGTQAWVEMLVLQGFISDCHGCGSSHAG